LLIPVPHRLPLNGVCIVLPNLSVHPIDAGQPSALDYPPFFAYFEKLLSIPAFLIDRKIVDLNNLNYDSWSVIAYQRTTVIVTELVLATALLRPVFFPDSRNVCCRVTALQIHTRLDRPIDPTHHLCGPIPPSWFPHRRPHSFPIQWVHVRNIPMVYPYGTKCSWLLALS